MIRAHVAAAPELSGAMYRVAQALDEFSPAEVVIVPTVELADLVVVHTIGTDVWPFIEQLEAAGKRYAVMQYCLRSTQEPNTAHWINRAWTRAACVWSYYDLEKMMREDGINHATMQISMPFYLAPLGADPRVFEEQLVVGDRYTILTSGYVAESECIAECWEAAARVGGRVFHLGPEQEFADLERDHVTFGLGITDQQLARAYSRSDYVAGMRRCEGFEMPAAEGLMCGARPLMLDAPHYRRWFNDLAVFVPEMDPATLTDSIADVFRDGPRPVSDSEISTAAERFNWERLVGGFWSRILEEFAR